MSELFPLRIVTGHRFCNRKQERSLLKTFITEKRPVALISPRRYGKSSLAYQVIKELKLPFCEIDFLTAYNDDAISASIIQGVSEIISQIMPINMKTLGVIEKCFRGIKAVIKYKIISLEFALPIEKLDQTRQVFEALSGLDKLATKINKSVVIFMDEFQRILETPRGEAAQGAIRNVAQKTKHIAFVFSGSSRHTLAKVFDDPNMPLYMMCEKMLIDRIPRNEYISYIQSAAIKKWSKELPISFVERILDLTEVHPFYVNYLCGKIWQNDKSPEDEACIDKIWHECLLVEERRLAEEIDNLTINQRHVLKEIANTANLTEPMGSDFLLQTKLSSGTIAPILKLLRKKDMIYTDKQDAIKVLDPLMKYLLLRTN